MKQLQLFASPPDTTGNEATTMPVFSYWKMCVDGAARNNPGPAGAGVYVLKDGAVALTRGVYLGSKTNNEAEYLALLLGLFELKKIIKQGDLVLVVSDSQLLIRQIAGAYKVKMPHLQQLHALARILLSGMNYDVLHVLREDNTEADALANEGVDTKRVVPADFLALLHNHGLSL